MFGGSEVRSLRKTYPEGTRLKLKYMDDVQAPPPGTEGTVKFVDDAGTIHVNWDNGSTLGLIFGEDKFQILYRPYK